MVSFNSIAPDYKLPGTSIEVDPSQAGTPVSNKWAQLVGIKTAAGSAPADIPIAVGTQADADALFGPGSMLARMFTRFFAINKAQTIYCAPVAEPGAGVAASGTATVSSAPTAAGTLDLYIAGQNVPVAIGPSDTATVVATNIVAAISAMTSLPVTATSSGAVVTLTCKWKGASGNDIRMEHSILGFYGGEALPSGLALTFSGSGFLASGTGTPTFTGLIANMGDDPYKFVGLPFSDSGTYSVFDTEFGFGDGGRWGWLRQTYGQVFSARRDTYSNLMAWGPANNSAVIHALGFESLSPSPVWEWTAAFTARAARAFTNDPARPLQTLTLDGIRPAPKSGRFNKTQINSLAHVGIAIQGTDVDGSTGGVPTLLREQSTYQKNTYAQADNAFEVATTLATLDEVFTRLRQRISNRYPRHKLMDNGTRIGPGQAAVSPNMVKAELISQYDEMIYDGLVENAKAFKDNLIVVRSSTDANTLECVYPPDLINQLRRTNIRAAFRLQFNTTGG